MPESIPDYASQISTLERKLRGLYRNIIGCAEAGVRALSDLQRAPLFEAQLEATKSDWEQFQKKWDELDTIQVLAGGDFPNARMQEIYDACRQEVIQARAYMLQVERKQVAEIRPAIQPAENRQSLDTTFGANAGFKAHLPKIPIPVFTGDLRKWAHFKDTFESLVHNEVGLTNTEKFHYLLSAVKGEAASLISSFPIEERSYSLAWDKLLQTYNNSRVLATFFIQQILDFESRHSRNELQNYERFLTGVADNIQGYKSLNLENSAEVLLAFLALRALDPQTRRQFEISRTSTDTFPSTNDVISFVRQRKIALTISRDIASSSSTTQDSQVEMQRSQFPRRRSPKYRSVNFLQSGHPPSLECTTSPTRSKSSSNPRGLRNQAPRCCPFCKEQHDLPGCFNFCNISLGERKAFVNSLKCCNNCLRQNHNTSECKSKFNCRFCKARHHSLLHEVKSASPATLTSAQFAGFGSASQPRLAQCSYILGTALLYIVDPQQGRHIIRAVIDSGSQHSFISQAIVDRLGFDITPLSITITGLGGNPVLKPSGSIDCTFRSCVSSDEFQTSAIVVDTISPQLPSTPIEKHVIQLLSRYQLADEGYHSPGTIDLLIGIDLYPRIINGAPFSSGVDELFLQPTVFGLVVMGKTCCLSTPAASSLFTGSQQGIEKQLKAFWELEEPKPVDRQDPDDKLCEEHFINTHLRTPEGRYIVRLPLKPDTNLPGRNREAVEKRFLSLERKFNTNHELAVSYKDFMQEYENLGHMSKASQESDYLIPHHAVWQEKPNGKKIRVVFDASCGSPTESLNSILLSGPKLQLDICEVLINFRLYLIPICADLVKMYRQILVHPSDRHLQHILWRSDPSEKIHEMELNTVTYGTRSSAYQALRVLRQLAEDEGSEYPLAVEVIHRSIYVDDIVSGANSIEEARELQRQLCEFFAKGGFTLSKWASTVPDLLPKDTRVSPLQLHHDETEVIKILGLVWNPVADAFSYTILQPPSTPVTKRLVLSAIARVFDPLGFLSPVVFLTKVLLQQIWREKLDWDVPLPPPLAEKWALIMQEWPVITQLSIPRYISHEGASFLLVGFCDASNSGYAASVYIRISSPNGFTNVSLIKSKTKVAPIKYLSVARMELCGALLLCRLLSSIKAPELNAQAPICFTDSKVVLSWIHSQAHQLKVFEANRVAQINDIVPPSRWRHVSSQDNPSDLASRGCLPNLLLGNSLWWHGPKWLSDPVNNWPRQEFAIPACTLTVTSSPAESKPNPASDDWMKRFSDVNILIRVVALIIRIARHVSSREIKLSGRITAEEFTTAKLRCVYLTQKSMSTKELSQLSPFVDKVGIIRVGGRLQEAPIEYARKHPMLLPRKAHFSHLIVDHIHQRNYHAGPSLTLALLRNEYWIPGALRLIRSRIQHCVKCRIRKAQPLNPIMAPLPEARLTQHRAFLQVGLDYAGPFSIKDSNRRKAAINKAYLCLFICMSTRALHLEVVSSLSTSAFLAALDRFISRRGIPRVIWSDHGTNFVGASRFLKDIYKFLAQHEDEIIRDLSSKSIEWRFIPPRAPHFGGSWEAGVKSAKSLLAGVMGAQPFTFEELSTAFIKIEGILNSRPLIPLTEDPEAFDILTPAHFLIGTSLSAIPEPDADSVPRKSTDRWECLQAHIRSIWRRWSRDYIHSLQQKVKWTQKQPNLKEGDLVIMVENRSLVGQWPVARISAVHPGKDGVVRSVTVRTPSGKLYVRPVVSLAPLFPIDNCNVHSA